MVLSGNSVQYYPDGVPNGSGARVFICAIDAGNVASFPKESRRWSGPHRAKRFDGSAMSLFRLLLFEKGPATDFFENVPGIDCAKK